MDSEPKAEDVKESEVSRFTLDGVVAEMVIEVDEEPNSPSKLVQDNSPKLNGTEKYEALKTSALRKSSVVLDSLSNTESVEDDSAKDPEFSMDLKSDAKQDKSEKVSDVEELTIACIAGDGDEDLVTEENGNSEIPEKQPELGDKKQPEGVEKHETAKEKQTEGEAKQLRSFGRKKSKVPEKKESNVSETLSKEESVKKEETVKRSSRRGKVKNVEDSGSANQTNKDDQIKPEPESRRKNLRDRPQANAAKTSLTTENKIAEKSSAAKEIIKRGPKRKIEEEKSKKDETPKKQKIAENAPEASSSGLKSNKPAVSKASTSKRQSLRKPATVPSASAKPKAYNLYPQNDISLDSFVEVKEQLNVADLKYLRALYRIMYDRWPPKDLEELKTEILQFQGFSFNRKSDELEKRQHVLKKLPDSSVSAICKILDLKEGTKENMISDIIKFLLKPVKLIYSLVDPFEPSMQPVVKLDKINIGECNESNTYMHSVMNLEDESNKATKISKRKRFPSSRLSEYVSGKEMTTSETKTPDSPKLLDSTKPETAKKRGRPSKKVLTPEKNQEVDARKPKNVASKKAPKKSEEQPVLSTRSTRNKTAKLNNSKALTEPTKEDESVTSLEIKEELEDEHDVPMETSEIKGMQDEPELPTLVEEQTLVPLVPEDSSGETTLSSDETKEQQTKQVSSSDSSRKKKVIHKRSGKALRCFNTIKDNICGANFNALQRLHILLFGASDKAENLKSNILSFGGFPFLEGSEEWKQKEFLLSLLAQNTLKEYLNLLCVEHGGDDDNHTLINKLMVFLAAPKEKASEEPVTQVVSSEPIDNAPVQETTEKERSVSKKATTSKQSSVVVPARRGPKHRKVLMDEEQVRRLENDFAREQRILEREKRQVQKAKLMDELKNESKSYVAKYKTCQAANCKSNSRDNADLSFFIFPTEPVRLEKWISNIELKPPNKNNPMRRFLCSKHFDVRAFSNTCKNARLLRFAVPTIPAPGSNRPIKYPCLDGYSTPGGSRLQHVPSPDKTSEVANTSLTMSIDVDTIPYDEPKKVKSPTKSPDSKKQAPLQKLIGDMTKKRESMMAQQTDSELLDALLQTVYKRRALKSAGAVISIPKKGVHTRLGELDNVKFLVVTANYNDLDVLHHLIYMTEASKTRVRKNILDFAGFNFAEDSIPYKDRMEFLKSLGYDISKRIGFLLGLCPYKMDIPQQDLNELIMYFLMSPCKSKQVPIRQLPHNFFTKDMPKELCLLLQKHSESISPESSPKQASSPEQKTSTASVSSEEDSPPKIVYRKAKKSFKSSLATKRVPTSPPLKEAPKHKPVMISPRGRPPKNLANKRPFQMPNILAKPAPAIEVRPPPVQKSILKPAVVATYSKAAPQEFLIQQQTPDGQQKTYKLIKLPPSHPLNSAIKAPAVQSQILPQLQSNIPIAGPPLPPGIIVFKNSPAAVNLQSAVNPIPQLSSTLQNVTMVNPELTITPVLGTASTSKEPVAVPPSDEITPLQFDETVEELQPLEEDIEPTDEELYSSIQEIIHNSNFEDITLRNVIDRVSAQYAAFNLKNRHSYMKECVKKIIMGT